MNWISIEERLPEFIKHDNGSVNCVLIYQKEGVECIASMQVWDAVYAHNNKRGFTHWMTLPEPPEDK